jgi:hypothetical protein
VEFWFTRAEHATALLSLVPIREGSHRESLSKVPGDTRLQNVAERERERERERVIFIIYFLFSCSPFSFVKIVKKAFSFDNIIGIS